MNNRTYWLEVNPETMLPTGKACSAYFGLSDKPIEGYWLLVEEISVPILDENQ